MLQMSDTALSGGDLVMYKHSKWSKKGILVATVGAGFALASSATFSGGYWDYGSILNDAAKDSGYHKSAMTQQQAEMDIVDVAVSAGDFNTLVKAVKKAGLVKTLKSDGPFTIFAPTDEAFAQIPPYKLNALLADKQALTEVLTYHVVPGRVTAADVMNLSSAKTVQGQNIRIDTRYGVRVNNAKVVKTDIMASNGVIHVIDTVILPN